MANESRKRIKILSRGVVLTSRGMARTPIDRPYLETISSILLLITRYKADVVEVLDDGREVKLTINNFNTNNSNVNEVVVENEGATKDKPVEPVQPAISKNMSRKERKRLEAERRRAEQAAQQTAEHTKDEITGVTTDKNVENTKDEIIITEDKVVDNIDKDVVETKTTEEVAPADMSENSENNIDELPEIPVE